MSLRERFMAFDDELALRGVPPLSPWWREGVGRWLDAYETGGKLELYACCGRGAAKSTCMYKLALFITLVGEFEVPPGERHLAIVLSRLKEEASKAIVIISAWLRLLGLPARVAGDVIEIDSPPGRGIRVVAASVAATSGWRAYAVFKDERAKWGSGGVDELDADEIDTSAASMTATHPNAPVVTMSSPWGQEGSFYNAITAGDDAARVVLGPVATWIAAPHVTLASCRKKERDAKKFAREFGCEFQAGVSSAFDDDLVAKAIRTPNQASEVARAIVLLDSSSGGGDSFAWARAQWRRVERQELLIVSGIHAVTGKFRAETTLERLVDRVAETAVAAGACDVFGDQYQSWAVAGLLAKRSLGYVEQNWSASSKAEAVSQIREWLREGILVIESSEEADALRRELATYRERLTSGGTSYSGRSGSKDDRVSLLLNLAMASIAGRIPLLDAGDPFSFGAPIRERRAVEDDDDGWDSPRLAPARSGSGDWNRSTGSNAWPTSH